MGSLILGSASPRRRHLLRAIVAPFDVDAADIDETPHPDEAASALARRLAREKAAALASRWPAALILAADSVVARDGVPLGKPAGADDARAMLRSLRGGTHRVVTGLALAQSSALIWEGASETTVAMRAYGDEEIERYIATGRPFDKAGAYAIQDREFAPVASIAGCYPNVVGLPLCETRRALTFAGFLTLPASEAGGDGVGTPACTLCTLARSIEPPA